MSKSELCIQSLEKEEKNGSEMTGRERRGRYFDL